MKDIRSVNPKDKQATLFEDPETDSNTLAE